MPAPAVPSRRLFLRRTALVAALGGIGLTALHHPWLSRALAQSVPASDSFAAFMHVSSYLTGKPALDAELGRAIYDGLADATGTFEQQLHALNTLLASAPPPAHALQTMLDKDQAPYAGLPKQIMTGWYLGIVGTGKTRRAVAFEQALMYAPVADVIVLNTYAHGVPGYWATPPVLRR